MYKLIIGNKNYSSWSMRGWLALAMTGETFEEVMVPLDQGDTKARILSFSPAGKVPTLIDGEVTVWDSLAIIEYLHEKHGDAGLWPSDGAARAYARSICAEMHSGFVSLRSSMPMNMRRLIGPRPPDDAVNADIERICAIWRRSRARYGVSDKFLFGEFSAVDAMFAPVVSRFETYDVQVGPLEKSYMEAVLTCDLYCQWREGAMREEWVIDADEVD
ncbi:MAG: glutathione S-transferase family protein [Hyphomicrobiales bacterium]